MTGWLRRFFDNNGGEIYSGPGPILTERMRRHAAASDRPTNQTRVTAWVRECFTEAEAKDAPERSLRTAEEALELAQAVGVDAETLHRLVDYVFSRPVGKPEQEIAGTMVTLYAMANALGVDADAAFETELARIQTPEVMDRCRRRQHEKREALAPSALGRSIGELVRTGRWVPFDGPKKRKSWNP